MNAAEGFRQETHRLSALRQPDPAITHAPDIQQELPPLCKRHAAIMLACFPDAPPSGLIGAKLHKTIISR